MKSVSNQNLGNFELGFQENMNGPIWINVGFQKRGRQNSQNLSKDIFYTLPATSAECIIGREKYPDACFRFSYDGDDHSERYRQIKETLKL